MLVDFVITFISITDFFLY